MGNKSTSSSTQRTLDMVNALFPVEKASIEHSDNCVYVPYWNGAGEIYTIRKVHPFDVPTTTVSPGDQLPGHHVPPLKVPAQLYTLTETHRGAYNETQTSDLGAENASQH